MASFGYEKAAGHRRARVADLFQVGIVKQGQNRVRIRRGDDFDLSFFLQFLVNWNHVLDDGERFVKDNLFVGFGKIAPLVYQRLERRLARKSGSNQARLTGFAGHGNLGSLKDSVAASIFSGSAPPRLSASSL